LVVAGIATASIVAITWTVVAGTSAKGRSATSSCSRTARPDSVGTVASPTAAPLAGPDAVRAALEPLDSTMFVSAHVGPPPPAGADGARDWFYATLNVPGTTDGQDYPELWEADLAAGVTAERMSDCASLDDAISGSQYEGVLPDGTTVKEQGGFGNMAAGQRFASPASDSQVIQSVTREAESTHFTIETIRVLHPLDDALYLAVTADEPVTDTAGISKLLDHLLAKPVEFEGVYLQVTSPDTGDVVFRQATAYRAGAGRTWTAPSLSGDA
jgi:hypothetical protein